VITVTMDRARKSRGVFFREHTLAHIHCKGVGIELGAAAHNPFGLKGSVNFAPEDDFDLYKEAQLQMCGAWAEVDVWGDALALSAHFPPDSQDYIISSHVLEHVPNLFKVLDEAEAVLKDGGTFFAIIPKRTALPADVGRPVTPLAEFIADYEGGITVETKPFPPDMTRPLEDGSGYHSQGRRGHYYVYTLESFTEAVLHHKPLWELVASEETDTKVGNGHTAVFRVNKAPVANS
jgi:SAM-dependent methyltransferase